ncbi:GIY-YIG nuclease family protein [Leptolyngbya sp. FACHB-16]|uniref:GIY-YIG nuclease family protein n=1 Tax=unclassified Leptolyngbya TaxID=2650499 RepID=UPI00168A0A93|nr:GIY-YIG nuclease family protein [Leptolyngbya sp. FACHB-16]
MTTKHLAGIYCIHNIKNQRKYVGKACQSIGARMQVHFGLMTKGEHHAKLMQADFCGYGEDAFCYEVLDTLPIRANDTLFEVMEYFWINSLNPEYNTIKNSLLKHRFKERLASVRSKRRSLQKEIETLTQRIQVCTEDITTANQEIEHLSRWLKKRQQIMQP